MPKKFTWKDGSSNNYYNGFLAHEVEDVTPESHAVFSKKDLGRFPTKNEIEDLLEGYQKVT